MALCETNQQSPALDEAHIPSEPRLSEEKAGEDKDNDNEREERIYLQKDVEIAPPERVCEGKIMKALKDDGLSYASSMDLSVWNVGTMPVKKRKRLRTANVVAGAASVEDILKKYQHKPRAVLQVSVFYEVVPGYSTMNKEVGHFSLDLSAFINEHYAITMANKRNTQTLPKKNSKHVQFETDVSFDFDGFAQLVRHFISVELGVDLGIRMKFIIDGSRVRVHKTRFHSVTSHATPYVPLLASLMRSRKEECYLALYSVEHSPLQVFFHTYSRISSEIERIALALAGDSLA